MALNVGELTATLALDTSKLTSGITESVANLQKVERAADNAAKSIGEKLTGALKNLASTKTELQQINDFIARYGANTDAALRKLGTGINTAELVRYRDELQKTAVTLGRIEAASTKLSSTSPLTSTTAASGELGTKLLVIGNSFDKIKRDIDVIGGAGAAAFANAAGDAVSMALAIGSGGVLGAVTALTAGIGLAIKAWDWFGNSAKKAADEAEKAAKKAAEAFSTGVTARLAEMRTPGMSDIEQASAEVAQQQQVVREAELRAAAAEKNLRIQDRSANLEISQAEALKRHTAAQNELNAARLLQLQYDAKLDVLSGRLVDAETYKAELAKQTASQTAAEKQVPEFWRESFAGAGGTSSFATGFGKSQPEVLAGFMAKAAAQLEKALGLDDFERVNEAFDKAINELERSPLNDVERLRALNELAEKAHKAEIAKYNLIASNASASLGDAAKSFISGEGIGGLEAVVSKMWTTFGTSITEFANQVVGLFKGTLIGDVFAGLGDLGSMAGPLAGVVEAMFGIVKSGFDSALSIVEQTVGAGIGKLAGGTQASSSFEKAQGIMGAGAGVAFAAEMIGPKFSAPIIMAGTGAIALGSAFIELTTQTKSFKQLQQMTNLTVGLVVNALEPMWRNLLPLAAVVYTVTSGLTVFLSKLIPSAQIAEAAFEAVKQFGLGVLNVAHGLIGIINNIDNQLTGGKNNLSFESVDDALKTLGEMSFESALGLVDFLTATTAATDSLMNVPTGYKVALARFQAMGAEYGPGTGNDLGEGTTREAREHTREIVSGGGLDAIYDTNKDTIVDTMATGLADVVTAIDKLVDALADKTRDNSEDNLFKSMDVTINTTVDNNTIVRKLKELTETTNYYDTGSTKSRESARKRA